MWAGNYNMQQSAYSITFAPVGSSLLYKYIAADFILLVYHDFQNSLGPPTNITHSINEYDMGHTIAYNIYG